MRQVCKCQRKKRMKHCPKCGLDKSDNEFRKNKSRRDGLHSYCKLCDKTVDLTGAIRNKVFRILHPGSGRDSAKRGSRKYRQNHPDIISARKFADRCLKRGIEFSKDNLLTQKEWEEILERYHHSCAYCGASNVSMTKDHVVPVTKGGTHTKDNIVPACRSCNSSKGNRPNRK
jgi:5-methylcytosine-specific restriction endonuclease McrA